MTYAEEVAVAPIEVAYQPEIDQGHTNVMDLPEHPVSTLGAQPRYWIEKTLVSGRPDRSAGDYAVGRALWSPQRAKGGADIYRFVREVQPNDVVLHLTDNKAFTGVSCAATTVETFEDAPDPTWAGGPLYRIWLRDYVPLDPPLGRDVFFEAPYNNRLVALGEAGTRNLFYDWEPAGPKLRFHQGAYLTPAPPELINILDDAYQAISGRPLIQLPPTNDTQTQQSVPQASGPSLEELGAATNLSEAELVELEDLLREKRQVILEGPPGSGKTYVGELFARYFTGNALRGPANAQLEIVQFHQSYGYEDFVIGIRPDTTADGQLVYDVRPGIFKRFCEVAALNKGEPFVIIIDEINRGNIARIFGELLLLLEYRDKHATLPYARPDEPPFSIPPNVYLIGTMNTTDRSLAQIDYALRRRFYFYRMLPVIDGQAPVLERYLVKSGTPRDVQERILRLFIALNQRVQQELGEQYQVGHSYVMTPDIGSTDGLQRVWQRAVMPLLEEYFFNRRDRRTLLQEFAIEHLSAAASQGSAFVEEA